MHTAIIDYPPTDRHRGAFHSEIKMVRNFHLSLFVDHGESDAFEALS